MAAAAAAAAISALHLLPTSKIFFAHAPHCSFPSLNLPTSPYKSFNSKSLRIISFSLAQSSDSPESDPRILLQELADCFALPDDYFRQLPRDLRLDLNDAAFDLSNGAVKDECGEELGETLLNISRAWELAEASTSAKLMSKLPLLVGLLPNNNKSGKHSNSTHDWFALGKRLVSASRRFQSMGQYGQGELQTIAKVMNKNGKLLAANPVTEAATGEAKPETRVLKFGELQVELTPGKAYVGALIGFIFGVLSWQVSQGIQSIPDSSLEYANDNALLLAKSLRGALLALFYSSTVLSAFAAVGLILLGGQLKSKGE
ncbi:Unknown protein [Striga hermonthica]|uniref:LOW protein: ammonium transporter 1-like protein n=1 Tax=Striga hermonthica TaxID=68872 RepID=A0A9N7P0U9_STRHE|nr:Unknown protein [Striga hermonthica]